MKFALTLGVAVAAITLTASAANTHSRTVIRHGGGSDIRMDADNDGWLTRAEATTAADQVFDQLDTNDDGRLTSDDRQPFEDIEIDIPDIDIDIDVPDVHVRHLELEGGEDGERRVHIIRSVDGEIDEEELERHIERTMEEAERQVERAERQVEQAERQARDAERQAERAERDTARQARHAERIARAHARAEAAVGSSRDVIIIRAGADDRHPIAPRAPHPPHPPHPPRPPMFMMLIANSDEADLNSDGAISREEFRAQHLRFFDASDANGDGRVRFEQPEPPIPPEAPTPPTPPEPPRNR